MGEGKEEEEAERRDGGGKKICGIFVKKIRIENPNKERVGDASSNAIARSLQVHDHNTWPLQMKSRFTD